MGDHCAEKRGVVVEVKKIMVIGLPMSMESDDEESIDDMSILDGQYRSGMSADWFNEGRRRVSVVLEVGLLRVSEYW